ncbi:MAG: ABC transporter ATP-binding protein [Anaerolineales bacterium]|nr:ABC transporter ATP-binding protein [Anaerolineales bacterium]
MSTNPASSEFTIEKKHHTNRKGPVRWIASHALHYWYLGLVMMGGAIGNAVLAAAVPVLIGRALNVVQNPSADSTPLLNIALLIIGSQIIRAVLQLARNFGAELGAQHIERDIRDELYLNLLGKSMTFHSLHPIGDTMARATNDVREINFLFSPGMNLVTGSVYFIIVPLFVAPTYHPSLILTPLVFTVLYFLALWQYLHELNPITTMIRDAFGVMNTRLAEAIDGIETVKSMAQEAGEIKLFRKNAQRFRDWFVAQGDIEARFLPYLLLMIVQAAGLLHASLLLKKGLLSVGDVVAYFGLLLMLGFPTFTSLFAYSQISLGVASAKRILEILNKETELDQNLQGFQSEIKGAVEFRNVFFAYRDSSESALVDISFKVKPGQTVAIVGQTGTGKTTLVKLINRTYDVSQGSVLVDGVDVRNWNMENLRKQTSIIEQDIFLFSRSIAENIKFGKPNATQDEVESAAKAAQAHDFILNFKDGYQTIIGERGVTLSGGQRQRLALARAFLTDPKILVLDDSTSAIDSATEDHIQRAIYEASKGRTTFLITHRLSQIRWADIIIVLRKGRIDAIGNHQSLMKTSEPYREIFSE